MKLEYVKDRKNKTEECGNCKYFFSNGWIAPGGKCTKHLDFSRDVCMSYKNFPDDATVCDDFEVRK